jgi:O-acetyl-ADP-ribose deacetylase (regulator of RNase III)
MFLYNPNMDLSRSDADVLVNTVNTVGTMGKGVALVFKQRFPDIMKPYQAACKDGRLQPGTFQIFKTKTNQTVINLATKEHWRNNSRYEWVGVGMVYMNAYFSRQKQLFETMAMPLPGAGNGGLDPARVQQMMRVYLHKAAQEGLQIEVSSEEYAPIKDPIFYAGVGSRDTPDHILNLMSEVGALMCEMGHGLRSGGAIGADTAFWQGVNEVDPENCEIFLPKKKYNYPDGIVDISPVFRRLAKNFHPSPDAITPDPSNPDDKRHFILNLMARNGCQVFGQDFRNPSNAVICWTKGGEGKGGTGQAIRLADSAGIPVLDLGDPKYDGIRATDVRDLACEMIYDFRVARGLPAEFTEVHPMPY